MWSCVQRDGVSILQLFLALAQANMREFKFPRRWLIFLFNKLQFSFIELLDFLNCWNPVKFLSYSSISVRRICQKVTSRTVTIFGPWSSRRDIINITSTHADNKTGSRECIKSICLYSDWKVKPAESKPAFWSECFWQCSWKNTLRDHDFKKCWVTFSLNSISQNKQ